MSSGVGYLRRSSLEVVPNVSLKALEYSENILSKTPMICVFKDAIVSTV